MNLSVRQLSTFLEVIRSGSISQAARTIGRTQPAVSTLISGLEEELGFALFFRQQGKLVPTPEAHYFREECEEILERLERSKRTLQGIATQKRGLLRIACHPAAANQFVPESLTHFMQDKPHTKVSMTMRSSAVIEDLVASQQVDLGLAETPLPRPSIQQKVFDMPCLVAMPADSPLTAKAKIRPHDLNGLDMAILFAEHMSTIQTKEIFDRAHCQLKSRFELRTFFSGLPFVEAGTCYMLCDMITAFSYQQLAQAASKIVFRPFIPTIFMSVSILTPAYSPQSLLTSSFADYLSERLDHIQAEMTPS